MPGYKGGGGGGMGFEGALRGLTDPTPGKPDAPLLGTKEGDLLSNLGVKGGGLLMGLNPW